MSGPSGTPPNPEFAAILERLLTGAAPLPVRSAAARGALPLPRAVLTRLYLHLRGDADEAVRSDAESSLRGLSVDQIREVLGDPACDAVVLQHFAAQAARDESLAEKVAFHPNADGRTLTTLASEGNAAVLDLVLTNQERLLSTPGLVDKLSMNPAMRNDQRGKLLDLIDRFFQGQAEQAAAAGGHENQTVAEAEAEQVARLLDIDVGELFAASEIMDGEEFAKSDDLVVRSAYKKILTLNTAQKAILAMKGRREERLIAQLEERFPNIRHTMLESMGSVRLGHLLDLRHLALPPSSASGGDLADEDDD